MHGAEFERTESAKSQTEFERETSIATRRGMRVAGIGGAVLAFVLIVLYTVVLQQRVALVGVPGVATAIWDELAIGALALSLWLLSYLHLDQRFYATIFVLAVWAASAVILLDDFVHRGEVVSTGYLALLMLVTVGLIPLRRVFVLVVGIGIMVIYLAFATANHLAMDADQIIFLGLLTILSAWISGYLERFRANQFALRERAAATERRYRALFQEASDAIFVIDNQTGVFQEVNPAFERLLGLSVRELRGVKFDQIIHPDDRDRVVQIHAGRIRGEAVPSRYQFRVVVSATKVERFCDVTIHESESRALTAGIARDLTDRIRAEETIRNYAAELERSNREIREAQLRLLTAEKTAAMGSLVAGVVHELNSPLSAVRCNFDVALRAAIAIAGLVGREGACNSDSVERVKKCAMTLQEVSKPTQEGMARISEVVSALRRYARLDESERQTIDLNSEVRNVIRLLQNQIASGVRVNTQFGVLQPLDCDARSINQMITVILERALAAVGEIGTITISTAMSSDMIHLTVCDDGQALSEEDRLHLFDPRFLVRSRRVGMGLELPIAHQIALAHGGTIDVQRAGEVGTTVLITIPLSSR